jgi:hypothetical protein
MKPLVLFVVDAFTSRTLLPDIAAGELPNLARVIEAGSMDAACSAVFPSITPAATASIATGRNPCDHGIVGTYWYDPATNDVAYHGDDVAVIFNKGAGRFFEDFLVKLNGDRLLAKTIFQIAEAAGRSTASLNYLIFKGSVSHPVHVPLLLKALPGVPTTQTVLGPSRLHLGDFVETPLPSGDRLRFKGGPFRRFGMDDAATLALLLQYAQANALPDFTLAYLPDHDYRCHGSGAGAGLPALTAFDAWLGVWAAAFGGMDAMLETVCLVLTGDHSISDLGDDDPGVRLDEILQEFELADAGKPWAGDDELKVCPNMRVAYVYLRQPRPETAGRICQALLADPRVDQVLMRCEDWNPDEAGFRVATADRGSLRFWAGGGGPSSAQDEGGGAWSWEGDLAAVDAHVSADGALRFGAYPNAFERIAGGLATHKSGPVCVTARPGFEFQVPGTKIHRGGGSHGSLHELDSIVPLIVAGAPGPGLVPPRSRTVDVAPLCLRLLGLPSDVRS